VTHPVHQAIRLTDGSFYGADPHPHLRWMRENAPVYWDAAGEVWGIARYEDVLAVSKDPACRTEFPSRSTELTPTATSLPDGSKTAAPNGPPVRRSTFSRASAIARRIRSGSVA